jgi:hypothetical protein
MPTGAAKISMLCRGFWSRRASSEARANFSGVQPQQSSGMPGDLGLQGKRQRQAASAKAGGRTNQSGATRPEVFAA